MQIIVKNMVKNGEKHPEKSSQKTRPKFKGIILDGRVYRAVVGPAFFQLCDRCDVRKDELCAEGTLGARLCNAFRFAYVGVPVRFRFSPSLTEALKNIETAL